jgi:hypothetical protein
LTEIVIARVQRVGQATREGFLTMPIQVKASGSLSEVKAKLHDLQVLYKLSNEEFESQRGTDQKVPEFDAIEWNFLLMQQRALDEDNCAPKTFSAKFESKTSVVDARDWREDVAA